MTKNEFIDNIKRIVNNYSESRDEMSADPQLRINPVTLHTSVVTAREMQNEIAFTDEDIDVAAAAEGDAYESADDYEASQDPDFFPLRELVKPGVLDKLADKYF